MTGVQTCALPIYPATGLPAGVGATITFHEPNADEARLGRVSVDSLFKDADNALADLPLSIWILMDRLDVGLC